MACNDPIFCLIVCHFVIFGQKLDIPVFYIALKVIEVLMRNEENLARIENDSY